MNLYIAHDKECRRKIMKKKDVLILILIIAAGLLLGAVGGKVFLDNII